MGRQAASPFLSSLGRDLRRGLLPIWIMEELRDGPTYGYLLLQRLRDHHAMGPAVGPSTLSPMLGRLRASGLVRTFHGTHSQGPIRKYYELTDSGRALLPLALEMVATHGRSVPVAGRRGTTGTPGAV